jgi:hypothetical protein
MKTKAKNDLVLTKKQFKQYIENMNTALNIPYGYRLLGVFENNDSDDLIGYIVVEEGREGDYPIMTIEQVISKYGYKK